MQRVHRSSPIAARDADVADYYTGHGSRGPEKEASRSRVIRVPLNGWNPRHVRDRSGSSALLTHGLRDESLDLGGRPRARRSRSLASPVEHGHRRDRSNRKPIAKLRHRVGVHLDDEVATGVARGDAGELWRDHAARTAPRGPEIDHHGKRRGCDKGVKDLGVRHFDRLGGRWQLGPAFLALYRLRALVSEGHSIALLAGGTRNDDALSSIWAIARSYCLPVSMSVRDGELAGNDRPRAWQEPAACEVADVGKDADKDDELDDICRSRLGQKLPDRAEYRLRDRHRPDRSVEVSPLVALTLGRTLHAREEAERPSTHTTTTIGRYATS